MKILIMSVVLLICTSQVFGQRRSNNEPVANPQVDSLNLAVKSLTQQLDSVSLELVKYMGVYNAIKEKVLHYSFDPTRSAFLIDSLQALRDSTSAALAFKPAETGAADSLKVLLIENKMLKAELDSMKTAVEKERNAVPPEELERAKALGNLKQLKELLDAKIITDAEYLSLKNKYLLKL